MTAVARAGRQGRQLWVAGVVLATFILSIGLPVYLNYQRARTEARIVRCVTDWANASAARSDLILAQSKDKNAATDKALRALAVIVSRAGHVTPADVAKLSAALNMYLSASNSYNNALALHPLPAAPQLACGGTQPKPVSVPTVVLTTTAPGGVVTATMPGSRMTRTVNVPQPTTITVPGAPQPGRTRTVTVTRTVTRNVAPPPCLTKLLPPCTLTAR